MIVVSSASRCPSLFGTTPLTQCQLTGPPSSILVKDINERIVSVRGYERNNEKSEKGDKSEFRIVEEKDVNFVDGMKKGKALMVEGYKFVYKSTRQLKDGSVVKYYSCIEEKCGVRCRLLFNTEGVRVKAEVRSCHEHATKECSISSQVLREVINRFLKSPSGWSDNSPVLYGLL